MTKPFDKPDTLWKWRDLNECVALKPVPGPDVQRVSIDSRLVQPGDLFVALAGDPGTKFNASYRSKVDGHQFVEAARRQGAVGAMVSRSFNTVSEMPLIPVDNTYDGLWALARCASARSNATRVAITGSSGKTTAKTFYQAATAGYANPGSFNNHIGVPISLVNTPISTVDAIYEIGTNHPGEIRPLAQLVQPHLAILLNVHSAHIENFSSKYHLRKEKVSIFSELRDKSMAVWEETLGLNYGYSFGTGPSADVSISQLTGDMATVSLFGTSLTARVPGGGEHRALTLTAVLLALHLLGKDLAPALSLPHELVPDGRGRNHVIDSVRIIDDSYNANPASMAAAFKVLQEQTAPRKWAIVGEMLELGAQAEQAHMQLGEQLKGVNVICVGNGTRGLAASISCPWYKTADSKLLSYVSSAVEAEDIVLVKGSNRVFWQNKFVGKLIQLLTDR